MIKWIERAIFPLIIVILLVVYFISSKNHQKVKKTTTINIEHNSTTAYPKELEQFYQKDIFGVKNSVKYIEYVINHGSEWLHYKGGVMEGGYISAKDAHKVACYVVHLSGRECKEGYPKEAQMYFSSVCAGCHGNDGKGLHGNYPDLTKKELDGLKRLYKLHNRCH